MVDLIFFDIFRRKMVAGDKCILVLLTKTFQKQKQTHYEKNVKRVTVNNSSNVNKTNNPLSSQLTEHENRLRHMVLVIHVLAWDGYKNRFYSNVLIAEFA